jgi:protease I
MKALAVTADGFEDSELLDPVHRLRAAGVVVEIASIRAGPLVGKHGAQVEADCAVADVRADDFALLLLPGGQAPAALRDDAAVLRLARAFVAAGKPVAAICHGPQILAAAGVLARRRVTGYRKVQDELAAAGAQVEDRAVVVDGALITSRQPGDLPAFLTAIERALGLA